MTVEWTDPVVAENWANGIVSLANELMRAKALVDSQRNIEYLKKQIAATNVVEMQRVMYGLVESETKTLMLANARADYAFTVVDPAVVPEARVRPKRRLMVLTGVAIGLIARDAVRLRARHGAEISVARGGGRGCREPVIHRPISDSRPTSGLPDLLARLWRHLSTAPPAPVLPAHGTRAALCDCGSCEPGRGAAVPDRSRGTGRRLPAPDHRAGRSCSRDRFGR